MSPQILDLPAGNGKDNTLTGGQDFSVSYESRDSLGISEDEDQWKVMEELHRQLRAASKIVSVLKAKVQILTDEKSQLEEREVATAARLEALRMSEAAWRAKASHAFAHRDTFRLLPMHHFSFSHPHNRFHQKDSSKRIARNTESPP